MLKSDLRELKKTTKITKATISSIAYCYVSPEKKRLCTKTESFLNLPESDQFKYLEFLKKIMSCKVDDTLQSHLIPDGDNKKLLKGINSSSLSQEALLDTFYEQVIENTDFVNGCCIILLSSDYDIPAKGTDGAYQGESDGVYSAVYGFICPMVMEEAGLCFEADNNQITSLKQKKIVGNPAVGFMYPDFHDRCPDPDKVAYCICDKKESYQDFASNVLGVNINLTAKEQKEIFNISVSEAVADESMDAISAFNDALVEKIDDFDPDKISTLSVEDVAELMVKSGISEEKAQDFKDKYKAETPDEAIVLNNVVDVKKKTYKNPDVVINVVPDKKDVIKTEDRDGKKCIVISLDSAVEINGVPCTLN